MAIDFSGNVWGISMNGCGGNGCASRLEMDRSGAIPHVVGTDVVGIGKSAYTYSDMAGYHLRHFTTEQGWYRQRFGVCPDHSTRWKQIHWEADVPPGTDLVIRARVSDFASDLPQSPWLNVVAVPSDESPMDLPSGLPEGHFIELEIRLHTKVEGVTPSVGSIHFWYDCTGPIPVV